MEEEFINTHEYHHHQSDYSNVADAFNSFLDNTTTDEKEKLPSSSICQGKSQYTEVTLSEMESSNFVIDFSDGKGDSSAQLLSLINSAW